MSEEEKVKAALKGELRGNEDDGSSTTAGGVILPGGM